MNGDIKAVFIVHGRCRERAMEAAMKKIPPKATITKQREAEDRLRAEYAVMPAAQIPVSPLSAAFTTAQRAKQFAEIARSQGVADVSIQPKFSKFDPADNKFRSVPADPELLAQAGL